MSLEEVFREVDRRVSEVIVEYLFEKLLSDHRRTCWREGCSCSYCKTKLKATKDIGNFRIPDDFDSSTVDFSDCFEVSTYINPTTFEAVDFKYPDYRARTKKLRQALRDHFHMKLEKCLDQ